MYAGNEYDGYGGASYGGNDYFTSDGYQGNNNIGGGSQENENFGGRNADEKKRRNNQSLIPMTIQQIEDDCVYDPEQGAYINNGYKLELVHLAGRIVDTNVSSTNLTLYIEDDTSQQRVMLQYYLKNQQHSKYDQMLTENMVPGVLLSCFGVLKQFKKGENAGELPYLSMYTGHILKNEAEYKAHGLAAKYASLYNAKGALRDRGKKPMQSSGDVGYGGQNQMSGMYGTNTYQGGNSLASMMGGQGQNSEEGREKERVLGFMRQHADPDSQGIAFERILRELSPVGLTHEKIRNALNLLLDEGNIYTTIDDSTYAVTE